MCRSYRFAGTAIFLLTAAVPAASFYALSFDRHIEAFVKERQLALAARINQVGGVQRRDTKPTLRVLPYYDQDHDGAVTCVQNAKPAEESWVVRYLHEAFEDSIPYFTSASVALRELMHKNSDDDSWSSHRDTHPDDGAPIPITRPRVLGAGHDRLAGDDGLPRHRARARTSSWSPPSRSCCSSPVVGAAYFVIAFLLQRVLLADVVEPIRRGRQRIVTAGRPAPPGHLRRPDVDGESRLRPSTCCGLTLAASGPDARTLGDIMREVSEAPASQRIAIADLEESPGDASVAREEARDRGGA